MEKKELMAELDSLKSAIVDQIEAKAATAAEAKVKALKAEVEALIEKAAKDNDVKAEMDTLKAKLEETVKGFNDLQTSIKVAAKAGAGKEQKSFGELYAEGVAENEEKIAKMKKGDHVSFEIKTVGNMLLSSNLTGDSVATYNSRQALVPGQKVNFRDLIPTVQSATGLYVTYRETGSEGAIANQTEGSSKSQIDYDLTEVKTNLAYKAGFARFSKQMANNLPFLQGTLPRMLMRDFYKQENADFFSTVSGAATGSTTTSATVDAEALVDYIANQMAADYSASYVLVNFAQWARLLKTKPQDYSVPGGVVIDPVGNIRICGVPVIGTSWVTDDKALIFDADLIERVEGESLRVDFSMEDGDNFTKNLITARIECFEAINVMRPNSVIYADFGNAS